MIDNLMSQLPPVSFCTTPFPSSPRFGSICEDWTSFASSPPSQVEEDVPELGDGTDRPSSVGSVSMCVESVLLHILGVHSRLFTGDGDLDE